MSKALAFILALAITCTAFLSIAPGSVQAAYDGTDDQWMAKGTLYNTSGGVIAQDVWFKFYVTFDECHLTIGHNNVGTHMVWGVETFGSSGTVNAMSGPYATVGGIGTVFTVDITELYWYGSSVNSVTFQPYLGGGVVQAPPPAPQAPASVAHSELSAIGLVGAIAGSMFILGGVFFVDRRGRRK